MKKIIFILIGLIFSALLLINSEQFNSKVLVNSDITLENVKIYKTTSNIDNYIDVIAINDENKIEENILEINPSINEEKELLPNKNENTYNNNDNKLDCETNIETQNEELQSEKNTTLENESLKNEENMDDKQVKDSYDENSTKTSDNIEKKEMQKEEEVNKELPTLKKTIPQLKQFQKNENTSNKTVVLVDKSGAFCAQALDYFYEDSKYVYYFTCIKSSAMYVIKNDKEYKLVEALKTGVTTIKELEANGYSFMKKAKIQNVGVK